MTTLGKGLGTTLLVLGLDCAHALPQQPAHHLITTANLRQSVTVLLRDGAGNHLGSGVLVGRAPGGNWVATNRHVVQRQRGVCVVGIDRMGNPAVVLPARTTTQAPWLDLALLWLPRSARQALIVAVMASQPVDAHQLPLVNATGYPTPIQPSPDGPPYTESEGLLLPLLRTPLAGGLDLAYTATVQKGMSGGGVFVGGELVGINATHAHPLWPGEWRDQAGREVTRQLNDKLELVSLGISVATIETELRAAAAPATAQLNSLSGLDCNAGRSGSVDDSPKRF